MYLGEHCVFNVNLVFNIQNNFVKDSEESKLVGATLAFSSQPEASLLAQSRVGEMNLGGEGGR